MKNFIMVFAIVTCCFSLSYANQYSDFSGELFIERCAEKIVDNRVYLKSGCVFVAQKDFIIKIDEGMAQLEAVYCDKEGIYVYDYQLRTLIQCGICDQFYDIEWQRSYCPHRPYN